MYSEMAMMTRDKEGSHHLIRKSRKKYLRNSCTETPNRKFVSFTKNTSELPSLRTYQMTRDIELRITAATKNFNDALGRTIFQKPQDQTRIKMSNVHGHNCEYSPLGMRYMGTDEEPAHETSQFSS
jgi:hypothetical protein